ncbi:hypothetical protein DFAR_3370013 [Desulfarculales bacterium]
MAKGYQTLLIRVNRRLVGTAVASYSVCCRG